MFGSIVRVAAALIAAGLAAANENDGLAGLAGPISALPAHPWPVAMRYMPPAMSSKDTIKPAAGPRQEHLAAETTTVRSMSAIPRRGVLLSLFEQSRNAVTDTVSIYPERTGEGS